MAKSPATRATAAQSPKPTPKSASRGNLSTPTKLPATARLRSADVNNGK